MTQFERSTIELNFSIIFSGLEEIKPEEPPEIDFAPDEEDVENQLMHIDDQLIRLDGNIEDITDHLDEQLLNTATINNAVESHDALLTQEEENYLFSSMPEVMDPMHGLQLNDPQCKIFPNFPLILMFVKNPKIS